MLEVRTSIFWPYLEQHNILLGLFKVFFNGGYRHPRLMDNSEQCLNICSGAIPDTEVVPTYQLVERNHHSRVLKQRWLLLIWHTTCALQNIFASWNTAKPSSTPRTRHKTSNTNIFTSIPYLQNTETFQHKYIQNLPIPSDPEVILIPRTWFTENPSEPEVFCKNPQQTHSKPGSPQNSKPPKRKLQEHAPGTCSPNECRNLEPCQICTDLMASRKWDLQLQLFGANQFSLTQIFLACKRFKEERQNLCLESNMQRRKGVRWDSSAGAHKHSQPGQYQGLRQANKWSLQTSCGQQSTPTQEHQTNKRATCSCLHA